MHTRLFLALALSLAFMRTSLADGVTRTWDIDGEGARMKTHNLKETQWAQRRKETKMTEMPLGIKIVKTPTNM